MNYAECHPKIGGTPFLCLWALLSAVLTLSITPNCKAQTSTADLAGSVSDPAGAVIPEAQVMITNLASGDIRRASSNTSGEFTIAGLQPGTYTLDVSHNGFEHYKAEGLVLHVGDRKAIQIKLQIGSVSETVSVNAAESLVTSEAGDVSAVIESQFVQNMPLNGRSLQNLILLIPGAITNSPQSTSSLNGQSGTLSVNGQGSSSNGFMVDGISANVNAGNTQGFSSLASAGAAPSATAVGTTQSIVPLDDLQEFRIATSSYAAEYGRYSGAQISLTTRSGSKEVHGSAFDYLRNDVFDANDWFNNYYSVKRQPLRQNDFGGTFSGPVVLPRIYDGRTRTFFFGDYEGLRLTQPIAAYPSYVPDATLRASAGSTNLGALLNAFPAANGADLGDGLAVFTNAYSSTGSIDSYNVRVDHSLSDNEKAFFRFAYTPSNTLQESLAQRTTSNQNTRSYTFGLTSVFSPSATNELRANFSYNLGDQIGAYWQQPGATPTDLLTMFGYPGSVNRYYAGVSLDFTQSTGISTFDGSNMEHQFNVVDSFTLTHGAHQFKAGLDLRRLASTALAASPNLGYYYYSAASVAANQFDYSYIYTFSNLYPRYWSFASFVQDEWHVSSNLHLSYGVRWELDPPPTSRQGSLPYALTNQENPTEIGLAPLGTPIFDTQYTNLAPRLGFSYGMRPHAGHETVIHGGIGVFYDLVTDSWDILADYYGPGFSAGESYCAASYCTAQLPSYNLPVPVADRIPVLVQPPIPPYRQSYANPPHLALPWSLQYNLAVQQNLGASDALTGSYVGSLGRKIIGNIESYIYPVNPDFTYILAMGNYLQANYNSAQVQYQHQGSHHLNVFAGYTWQHAIGEQQVNNYGAYVRTNSGNGNGRYAEDVRQVANAALTWEVPTHIQNRAGKSITEGWGTDLRFFTRTGFPLLLNSPQQATPEAGGSSVSWGLNYVAGEPVYIHSSHLPGGKQLNPAAFTSAAAGDNCNVPLNYYR